MFMHQTSSLLLEELASKAANSLDLGIDRIASHLLKRQVLRSTSIGCGVAIRTLCCPMCNGLSD
jgi:hypothetical protein